MLSVSLKAVRFTSREFDMIAETSGVFIQPLSVISSNPIAFGAGVSSTIETTPLLRIRGAWF